MQKIVASEKLYIAPSKIHNAGRGVFAGKTIKKGTCIEICPVIPISESDTSNLTESVLITYFYYFGKKKERSLVALGFGSIYNHSHQPNAIYKEKPNEQVIEFWSSEEIKKGAEITVNYIQNTKDTTTPLWFAAPTQ